MDKLSLVNLCSRAWSVPALALMAQGAPLRVSPLAHAVGAGRTAMGATFHHLEAMGLIRRASGHGHPLRPEFELTRAGQAASVWAAELMAGEGAGPAVRLIRKRWTLPVLSLLERPARFGALRQGLPAITDRALSLTLKDMVACEWARRDVRVEATPPEVRYGAHGAGAWVAAHAACFSAVTGLGA